MGDPAPAGGWRGWAALLAGTLPQPELHNLATLGALAADVERTQLPAATALRPDVASVVVGINDTLRGDFDPERTGVSVGRTVAALRAAGAEVLTMRLPDPGQMFGLPGALARPLARRMRAVNAVVDEVARRHGTLHLDAARDPATYERRYWSVDRLHPNERGHRLIACRFHALLAAAEFPVVGPGPDPEPSSPPPTRLAEVGWMATKGTAWLVRRSRDLVPALVGLALREWLGIGHEELEREGAEPEPVNLNVLSKPSGNLQLHECVPSARLKVRNRLSKRNERTKPHDGSKLRTTPMSQNYDPNSYPGGYGWPGYASAPPPPPRRRNHKRGLIVTGAVALAAGAAAGGLIGSSHGLTASTMTAASRTPLSASQIAQRVDPSLVDVVSTLGDQGASAAGTGIVLTSDGTVLTNNHVIRGATSIKVTDVGNGRTYTAKVVGYDASKDVAVIQLQNASGLTTANLGDSSSVQSGDSVTALGNAGGKGGTPSVATGTVTALNQGITASDEGSGANSEQLTGLIETNADIQPGDSGGALVNSYGQVIGMNTAASSGTQFQSQSDQATVQAYAIPVDNAESIAKQVEAGQGSSTVHIGATAFLGIESDGSSSGSGSGSGSGDSGGFGDGSGFGGFGDGSGFGGFGSQGDGSGTNGSGTNGSGTNGSGTSSGVTIAGALAGSPAASAWPDRGRHDHLGGRPGGLLAQRHRADPGQVPPRRQDLGQLAGPVRAVADHHRDPRLWPCGLAAGRGGQPCSPPRTSQ